jgi:hypothetical protein
VAALTTRSHHSPQRIEVITSLQAPGEMIFNSILGSVLVYTLLGLTLEGGAIQHGLSPRWASSSITPTCARGAGSGTCSSEPGDAPHSPPSNRTTRTTTGDFPWWDKLFGTYEKPADLERDVRLRRREGAEARIDAALRWTCTSTLDARRLSSHDGQLAPSMKNRQGTLEARQSRGTAMHSSSPSFALQ